MANPRKTILASRLRARCAFVLLWFAAFAAGGVAATFVHPGLLNNRDELEFVRRQVVAGAEPWRTAYEIVSLGDAGSLAFVPSLVVEGGP